MAGKPSSVDRERRVREERSRGDQQKPLARSRDWVVPPPRTQPGLDDFTEATAVDPMYFDTDEPSSSVMRAYFGNDELREVPGARSDDTETTSIKEMEFDTAVRQLAVDTGWDDLASLELDPDVQDALGWLPANPVHAEPPPMPPPMPPQQAAQADHRALPLPPPPAWAPELYPPLSAEPVYAPRGQLAHRADSFPGTDELVSATYDLASSPYNRLDTPYPNTAFAQSSPFRLETYPGTLDPAPPPHGFAVHPHAVYAHTLPHGHYDPEAAERARRAALVQQPQFPVGLEVPLVYRRHKRLPLAVRKQKARAAARSVAIRRTTRPLHDEHRAGDPTSHGEVGLFAGMLTTLAHMAGSAGMHGAVIGASILFIGFDRQDDRDQRPVAIEVRQRVAETKKEEPPVEKEKAAAKKQPERLAKVEPKQRKIQKREVEKPAASSQSEQPQQVIGLSFESTTTGGSGPGFAVGNTRAGETSRRAVDPRSVNGNRVAVSIPTDGTKLVLPKRKHPVMPAYPPELEAQGIEADVPVLVSIDAQGRVTKVKILRTTPYPKLNEAARRAALAEEFEPAKRGGEPIPYSISYTYRFRLKD